MPTRRHTLTALGLAGASAAGLAACSKPSFNGGVKNTPPKAKPVITSPTDGAKDVVAGVELVFSATEATSTKLELTQAMSVVAGHVAETSSAYTKQLEDLTVRLEIERALQQGSPYGWLYLPAANGGRLEDVRVIVSDTIQSVLHSGESANQASAKLAAGDEQLKAGHFKQAFRLYSEAYKAAVSLPPKQR